MTDARGNNDATIRTSQELKSKLTIGDQSNPIDEHTQALLPVLLSNLALLRYWLRKHDGFSEGGTVGLNTSAPSFAGASTAVKSSKRSHKRSLSDELPFVMDDMIGAALSLTRHNRADSPTSTSSFDVESFEIVSDLTPSLTVIDNEAAVEQFLNDIAAELGFDPNDDEERLVDAFRNLQAPKQNLNIRSSAFWTNYVRISIAIVIVLLKRHSNGLSTFCVLTCDVIRLAVGQAQSLKGLIPKEQPTTSTPSSCNIDIDKTVMELTHSKDMLTMEMALMKQRVDMLDVRVEDFEGNLLRWGIASETLVAEVKAIREALGEVTEGTKDTVADIETCLSLRMESEKLLRTTESNLKELEDKYGALDDINTEFARQIAERQEWHESILQIEKVTHEMATEEQRNHINALNDVVAERVISTNKVTKTALRNVKERDERLAAKLELVNEISGKDVMQELKGLNDLIGDVLIETRKIGEECAFGIFQGVMCGKLNLRTIRDIPVTRHGSLAPSS